MSDQIQQKAFPVGTWPLAPGTYDPALDSAGIPADTVIFGLFDESYKKYDSPESIPGLMKVSSVGEMAMNTYYVLNATSGFDYVLVMSDADDITVTMSEVIISYEAGLKLIEERCGNGKDNIISLATIAPEPNADGKPRPFVRDVDAYYEEGTFYVTTSAKSRKMQQIAQNPEVAFSVCFEWFSGNGLGENLGWVLDPKNAEIRAKLRTAFANWYDVANNENDENCCILAIRFTSGTVIKDHGAVRYQMDFVNKTTY